MLKTWYVVNKRNLPWRETMDPYLVWLSEIVLQQTKVTQGLNYYLEISKQFPNVESLANAKENELLLLWQGLGYYSRALNLHKTAKIVAYDYGGVFPGNYIDLLKLPGVGSYTAAAIASFCYKEAVPVLDGNVYRLISRVYGITEPINTGISKKIFMEKLNGLIPHKEPDVFNQAIMEFGALHCKPAQPLCPSCPFNVSCVAFNTNTVKDYPVKRKAKPKRVEFRYYFVLRYEDKFALLKRGNTGIWKNLFEFPSVVEENEQIDPWKLLQKKYNIKKRINKRLLPMFNTIHILSHIKMEGKFFELTLEEKITTDDLLWIKSEELDGFALHQLMRKFLNETDFK
jgi:A/G-specific adenine glycosylase